MNYSMNYLPRWYGHEWPAADATISARLSSRVPDTSQEVRDAATAEAIQTLTATQVTALSGNTGNASAIEPTVKLQPLAEAVGLGDLTVASESPWLQGLTTITQSEVAQLLTPDAGSRYAVVELDRSSHVLPTPEPESAENTAPAEPMQAVVGVVADGGISKTKKPPPTKEEKERNASVALEAAKDGLQGLTEGSVAYEYQKARIRVFELKLEKVRAENNGEKGRVKDLKTAIDRATEDQADWKNLNDETNARLKAQTTEAKKWEKNLRKPKKSKKKSSEVEVAAPTRTFEYRCYAYDPCGAIVHCYDGEGDDAVVAVVELPPMETVYIRATVDLPGSDGTRYSIAAHAALVLCKRIMSTHGKETLEGLENTEASQWIFKPDLTEETNRLTRVWWQCLARTSTRQRQDERKAIRTRIWAELNRTSGSIYKGGSVTITPQMHQVFAVLGCQSSPFSRNPDGWRGRILWHATGKNPISLVQECV